MEAKREIPFKHDNIMEYGVEGLLEDLGGTLKPISQMKRNSMSKNLIC